MALDPKKRFIQVETSFFWRWWIEQDENTKEMVKQMVNEGRLEFVGGGWTMHDEATVHYSALIDNMAFGFKNLHDWFGNTLVCFSILTWPSLAEPRSSNWYLVPGEGGEGEKPSNSF